MKSILSVLGVLLFISSVRADMAPIVSYKKELGKGKYLLVMLYPKENSLNKKNPLNDTYPDSGLYPNDGSNKPIWTVAAPFMGQVFLSANGEFLANVVFPAERKGSGICFYHKGKLIRAYKVEELARPESIQDCCPSCLWRNNVSFNEADESIHLESRDGRTWRFELRTGDAVAQHPNPLANLIAQAGKNNPKVNEGQGAPRVPAQGFEGGAQGGSSGGLGAGWIIGIVMTLVVTFALGGFVLWRFGVTGRSESA